jgi:nicotinamide mononucleotide transporter
VKDLLSVDSVFFTFLGYPMSYIELAGTILYLLSVWLIARRNMLTWSVGIVSVLLFMALFYQIQLYSDTIEQVYYLGASIYGWWYWSKSKTGADRLTAVRFSDRRTMVIWVAVTVAASVALGAVMSSIHIWAPAVFPEPASYPYLDALTTVMSFVAMWLLARKRTESWAYWIIVDVIAIWLYFVKDVKLISLLYLVLLGLATKGLADWTRASRRESSPAVEPAEVPSSDGAARL